MVVSACVGVSEMCFTERGVGKVGGIGQGKSRMAGIGTGLFALRSGCEISDEDIGRKCGEVQSSFDWSWCVVM
jgi:hypothetical protein